MKRAFICWLVRRLRAAEATYETNGSEWRDYLCIKDRYWQ